MRRVSRMAGAWMKIEPVLVHLMYITLVVVIMLS